MNRRAWWIAGMVVVLAALSLGAVDVRKLRGLPPAAPWVKLSVVALQFECDPEEGEGLCTELALEPPATLQDARERLKDTDVSLLGSASLAVEEAVGAEFFLGQQLAVPTKWVGQEDEPNVTLELRPAGLKGAVRARVLPGESEGTDKVGMAYELSAHVQCAEVPEDERFIEFELAGFGVADAGGFPTDNLCLVGTKRVRVGELDEDEDPEYRLVGVVIFLRPTPVNHPTPKLKK